MKGRVLYLEWYYAFSEGLRDGWVACLVGGSNFSSVLAPFALLISYSHPSIALQMKKSNLSEQLAAQGPFPYLARSCPFRFRSQRAGNSTETSRAIRQNF